MQSYVFARVCPFYFTKRSSTLGLKCFHMLFKRNCLSDDELLQLLLSVLIAAKQCVLMPLNSKISWPHRLVLIGNFKFAIFCVHLINPEELVYNVLCIIVCANFFSALKV